MDRKRNRLFVCALLLVAAFAVGQDQSAPAAAGGNGQNPNVATVRGCLRGQRGNYILIEDRTSQVYVLKGVGNKLESQRRHEVEVKGTILPGRIKTGVNPDKAGSNPADTVHGVDGVPLQVADVKTDVRTIGKCKAADEQ